MNLYQLVGSPSAQRLGMFLSQHMPEGIGHRMAWFAADIVCWRKPAVYHTLQANLRQVVGSNADQRLVEWTTRRVFYHFVRGYYDLYRALRLPPEKLVGWVELPEASRRVVGDLSNWGRGALMVFPHLGNFDLAGQVIASYLPECQVLSLPNPSPGFRLSNELRKRGGVQVTPLAPDALRQAIRLLRRGGVVGVAGDRPVSELDDPIPFFGRPARVPSGHVRLALSTDSAMVVTYCVLDPGTHRYTLHFKRPMEPVRTGDRNEDVQTNMRRLLDALEEVIRRWLEQWQMFVPVWPELSKV